ncbi:MAG: hypothetical protein ACRCUY_08320 [Thermoguttaceae bacterium]
MAIQIEIDGILKTVTKEELFSLAASGAISPTTPIEVNGKRTTADKVREIVFGQPVPVVEPPPIPPAPPSPRSDTHQFDEAFMDAVFDDISIPTTTSPDTHQLGRMLVSENGKGNPSIVHVWFWMLLLAGINLFVFCVILPAKIRENNTIPVYAGGYRATSYVTDGGEKSASFMFWSGIGISIFIIIYTAFNLRGVAKTEVIVYEQGITGRGCGKYYDVNFDMHTFQYAYDKITGIDATQYAIMIHASGAQYKCYVKNPKKILNIIVSQQQKKDTSF